MANVFEIRTRLEKENERLKQENEKLSKQVKILQGNIAAIQAYHKIREGELEAQLDLALGTTYLSDQAW